MTTTEQDERFEAIIRKLKAMLAKAASTSSEEEAEALTAKAEAWMARYAIDLVMLEGVDASRVRTETWTVPGPYAAQSQDLLLGICAALGVRAVLVGASPIKVTVVGFAEDVAWAELLHQSLVQQQRSGLARAMAGRDKRAVHGRTYAVSFCAGFRSRVTARLQEVVATAQAEAEVEAEAAVPASAASASSSVALVLASKATKVDEALHERFPRLRTFTSRRSATVLGGGFAAGTAAGASATIARGAAGAGQRGALSA